jgi:uncharacterized protein (UPF0332 family)
MTWFELSHEMRRAAKILLQAKLYRASVSRSYFAVYAGVTGILIAKGKREFSQDRQNPSHEQLPDLVEVEGSLPIETRRKIKRTLRRLAKARVEADYKPDRSWIGFKQAHAHFLEAIQILEELGVRPK